MFLKQARVKSLSTIGQPSGQVHVVQAIFFFLLVGLVALLAMPAFSQNVAFKQAIAEASASDKALAAFYKGRDFEPIWTGRNDRKRLMALFDALTTAPDHGLPIGRYDAQAVKAAFSKNTTAKARGQLEVETSRMFLQYASDLQTGILEPRQIDRNMTLRPPRRDRLKTLEAFVQSTPDSFLKGLIPSNPDYTRLLKEKARMERVVGAGGWGPTVAADSLKLGASGPEVVVMRKRLTQMNYGNLGASPVYDEGLQRTIEAFQIDHGLNADGVAGKVTLSAINTSPETRLKQVIIALERLRWLNKALGKRHIIVNEAAFTATVFDNGKPSFETRVVVGKPGRWRTPEFEEAMTHLIVNPSWFVPDSIAGGEYLPQLRENPGALERQGIIMTDADGHVVDSTTVDYSAYTKTNFPYTLRQPPGNDNALGIVKFMFPNRHAIYLHDTPSKSLFGRDIRTYSHGCVRVQDPYDLAYTLLAKQSSNPKSLFDSAVARGVETVIQLDQKVPIYLVYHTAWVGADGRPNYRADSYSVDEKLFSALAKAGVVSRGVRG